MTEDNKNKPQKVELSMASIFLLAIFISMCSGAQNVQRGPPTVTKIESAKEAPAPIKIEPTNCSASTKLGCKCYGKGTDVCMTNGSVAACSRFSESVNYAFTHKDYSNFSGILCKDIKSSEIGKHCLCSNF